MGFASPPHDGFALSQRTRMRVQVHMIPTADEFPMDFAPFSALFGSVAFLVKTCPEEPECLDPGLLETR